MKVTGGDSWGLMPSLSGIRFIEDGGGARGGGSLQQTRPSGARFTRSTTLCFSLAEIKLCLSPISRNSIEINIFFPNVVKTKDYSKRSRKNRSEEGEKRKNIYSV